MDSDASAVTERGRSLSRVASAHDMTTIVSDRVRIGTCSGPADAALVRSIFAAHGVDVIVAGDKVGLGGLAGGLVSLDIWVARDDSEEAVALLNDLRERDGSDEDNEYDVEAIHRCEAVDSIDEVVAFDRLHERRRRTGVALLLGCCITFGTAHMFTGAWLRAGALAAFELVGIMWLSNGDAMGVLIVFMAILGDLVGAVSRIRATPPTGLPIARVHDAS